MKMTKKIVLLTIFCLAAIGVAAQKQIDEKEYHRQFYAANDKSSTAARREIIRDESYKNGKLWKTEDITDEFVPPDRRHYIYVAKVVGDKDSLEFELIKIGDTYYCRDGNKWRQAENWCANGSTFGGLSNIVSSEFTVEEAKLDNRNVMLYQQYTVYKNTFVPEKPVLSYMKSKFWVNGGDGFLLREEREFGAVEPAKVNRKIIHTHEYDPNLKIEAPAGAVKTKTK